MKHYRRLMRRKGYVYTGEPGSCDISDCTGKRHGRGLCLKHYKRLRRHGNPLKRIKHPLPAVCKTDGCSGTPHAKGQCSACYSRAYYAVTKHYARKLKHTAERNSRVGSGLRKHRLLDAMHEVQKGTCGICNKPLPDDYRNGTLVHVDHIFPLAEIAKAGDTAMHLAKDPANLQLAHAECNRRKRDSVIVPS